MGGAEDGLGYLVGVVGSVVALARGLARARSQHWLSNLYYAAGRGLDVGHAEGAAALGPRPLGVVDEDERPLGRVLGKLVVDGVD